MNHPTEWAEEYHGLQGCIDCTMAIANGDYPEDEARFDAVLNGERKWASQGYVLVATTEEDTHFSWASCDVCGSTLGGDRHPLAAVWWARR